MNHDEIMSKTIKILAKYIHDHTIDSVDEKSLSSTTDFAYDLGMDSMAMAEFFSELETEFYTVNFFSNGEIDACETLGDLVKCIEKQMASPNGFY